MSLVHTVPATARKRMALGLAAVLAAAGLATMAPMPSDANPLTANCENLPGERNIEAFMTHAEVGEALDKIVRTSKGKVAVEVAGHTNQGQPIWFARVGHGDTVVLVESQIHGNEPHGTIAARGPQDARQQLQAVRRDPRRRHPRRHPPAQR